MTQLPSSTLDSYLAAAPCDIRCFDKHAAKALRVRLYRRRKETKLHKDVKISVVGQVVRLQKIQPLVLDMVRYT